MAPRPPPPAPTNVHSPHGSPRPSTLPGQVRRLPPANVARMHTLLAALLVAVNAFDAASGPVEIPVGRDQAPLTATLAPHEVLVGELTWPAD